MEKFKKRHSIVVIEPKYLRKQDAIIYLGVGKTVFSELVVRHGLTVYGENDKLQWYSVKELDAMIEKNVLIQPL